MQREFSWSLTQYSSKGPFYVVAEKSIPHSPKIFI